MQDFLSKELWDEFEKHLGLLSDLEHVKSTRAKLKGFCEFMKTHPDYEFNQEGMAELRCLKVSTLNDIGGFMIPDDFGYCVNTTYLPGNKSDMKLVSSTLLKIENKLDTSVVN